MKQVKARVLSNVEVLRYPGAACFLMQVDAAAIAADGRPGQFLMLKCGKNSLLRRPLSIHGVSADGRVRLLYRVGIDAGGQAEGRGTGWLSRLGEGDSVDILGPLGNGFSVEAASRSLLLVAGGIGIAPLGFLAETAVAGGREVVLLMGARSAAGILPQNMLPSGVTCVFTTDDGSAGKKGPVTDILREYMARADQVYACGPRAMLEKVASVPGLGPAQVSLEVRMGCGAGACYGCSIRTVRGMRRVCREGPVFHIKDIIWQEVSI
ncbi:MAG: dihydroorotate dehydrogenase electron transfer subunit [Chloroflexi bacterium]|nr:dihydroorotate dehydrogenase electron transfer subunit [Chloroflexota bacterium]